MNEAQKDNIFPGAENSIALQIKKQTKVGIQEDEIQTRAIIVQFSPDMQIREKSKKKERSAWIIGTKNRLKKKK